MGEVLPYIAGVLFAVLAPLPALRRISPLLWRSLAREEGIPDHVSSARVNNRQDLPLIIGILERPLYLAAVLLKAPTMIGIWLGIKLAGGWQGFTVGQAVEWDGQKRTVLGRHISGAFLISATISLLNGLVGAGITHFLLLGQFTEALWLAIPTVAATYGVWAWCEAKWGKPQDSLSLPVPSNQPLELAGARTASVDATAGGVAQHRKE